MKPIAERAKQVIKNALEHKPRRDIKKYFGDKATYVAECLEHAGLLKPEPQKPTDGLKWDDQHWDAAIADMELIIEEDNKRYEDHAIPASTVWSNGQILMGLQEGKRLSAKAESAQEDCPKEECRNWHRAGQYYCSTCRRHWREKILLKDNYVPSELTESAKQEEGS